jgi:Gpi18-like mannosyltransferase
MNTNGRSAPSRTLSTSVWLGFAILVLALLTMQVLLWKVGNSNFDMRTAYLVWQQFLIAHGRWHALAHPIDEYFPAYYELTTITSYLDGHFSRVAQIKIISLCFDIFAAAIAYVAAGRLIARKGREGPSVAQLIAPLTILAGPTVIVNGSVWGQCDIIYTSFLLLCVLAVVCDLEALAPLFFGFALAFKLQAVFLVPFVFAMLLARRIRWRYLLLVPVGWAVSLVPPLLNGANLFEYLGQPGVQMGTFPALAINVGNPWGFAQWAGLSSRVGLPIGLAITAALVLALGLWGKAREFKSTINTFALAAFSAQAMPYFMPKMNDRYFFTGEILLSILSCADPAFALPAGLVIMASLLSYGEYFSPFARHFILLIALLANSIALWLVFRRLRFRLQQEAETLSMSSFAGGAGGIAVECDCEESYFAERSAFPRLNRLSAVPRGGISADGNFTRVSLLCSDAGEDDLAATGDRLREHDDWNL